MSVLSCHPYGLIVIAILTLSSVHIKSEIWSNEVSDIQYGNLNSNITLLCGGTRRGSSVEWRLNGSALGPGRVALSPDGSLTLVHTSSNMEGNYTCYDRKGVLLHTVILRLGHVPGRLIVKCTMANHHSVRCSWRPLVNTHLPTKYTASYRDQMNKVETCHQEPSKPNECTILDPTTWHHSHTINITEINPLGVETTLFLVKFHELLKPDPPEDVKIKAVEGEPTRLRISWRYPSTWPQSRAFPLSFQLRYRPMGSSIWSEVKTNNTTLMIMDALAGHLHTVQLQAADDLSFGQWSDWTPELLAMPWTVPVKEEVNPTGIEDLYDLQTEQSYTESPGAVPSEYRNLGVLISLGLFAGLILAMLVTLIILLWLRQKRRDMGTKQELASMMTMKSMQL
ncbi:interleukin-11 receptor subunit alpha [Scleropages formosus]|uniref:Interleukin 11 receptor subunit alpha n=1 Tax=Scleropages formosus TaxID=113540 RepID=A0A8C9S1T6_SCLFO|nr:interleukin-11 receptor subunit alpha [Scleropages formosus]XP_018608303.1 interleukin-11 receptor subunit alpha [Scleropages formosus]XP_018608311.1 interleukin-11 receptor subunit alpha [Scleropages formosus]